MISDRKQQVVEVLVTLAAAVIALLLGAPDKWLAAIFATVVTFGGLISYFKPRWASGLFWKIIAGALIIHLLLIWLIFAVVLRQRTDVGLVVCIPFIVLEYFLLCYVVRFLGQKLTGRPGRDPKHEHSVLQNTTSALNGNEPVLARSIFIICFVLMFIPVLALVVFLPIGAMAIGSAIPGIITYFAILLIAQVVSLAAYFRWPWIAALVGSVDLVVIVSGFIPLARHSVHGFLDQFGFDVAFFALAQIGFLASRFGGLAKPQQPMGEGSAS